MAGKRSFSKQQIELSSSLSQAQRRIMDILAQRDHSELEIRKKLALRFTPETCELAMTWAQENRWIPSEEKMQDLVVNSLGRRKKGQRYINQKLKSMGLATVQLAPEIELEKALLCIETKFRRDLFSGLNFKSALKERARVTRFLLSRGFGMTTAQEAIKDYFKNDSSIEDPNYD
jgi:regulatory protein